MTRAPLQIVVLGGGYAGVLAARRLARGAGPTARVTLVDASDTFVERIRLHQVAAGATLRVRPIASLIGRAIFRRGRVRALDLVRKQVVLDDGVLDVDYLVNALGSAVQTTAVAGVAEHALRLDDPASAGAVGAAARRALEQGATLAVVGGGLTGIELATELAEAHPRLSLALYCRGHLGAGALGPAAVAHVRAALAGVAVHEQVRIERVEADALIVDGARVAVAAVVWCAGFVASPLAAAAGLAVDAQGRMLVDDTLAVPGLPWLFGAGDAAAPLGPVGAPLPMACKTAMPMAATAADNLLAALHGAAPHRFRFGDTGVCVSLGRRDGVIQHRGAQGDSRGVTRGRVGAWVKESVCRFTLRALRFPVLTRALRLYDRRGARALAAAPAPHQLPSATP